MGTKAPAARKGKMWPPASAKAARHAKGDQELLDFLRSVFAGQSSVRVPDAARKTGLASSTIYTKIRTGALPGVTHSHGVLIDLRSQAA